MEFGNQQEYLDIKQSKKNLIENFNYEQYRKDI